jgi:hypothetical protein
MNLVAGEDADSTQYSFFSVSMRLTDAGHGSLLFAFFTFKRIISFSVSSTF